MIMAEAGAATARILAEEAIPAAAGITVAAAEEIITVVAEEITVVVIAAAAETITGILRKDIKEMVIGH